VGRGAGLRGATYTLQAKRKFTPEVEPAGPAAPVTSRRSQPSRSAWGITEQYRPRPTALTSWTGAGIREARRFGAATWSASRAEEGRAAVSGAAAAVAGTASSARTALGPSNPEDALPRGIFFVLTRRKSLRWAAPPKRRCVVTRGRVPGVGRAASGAATRCG